SGACHRSSVVSLRPLFIVFSSCSGHHRYLHSFPTRRSSDLLLTLVIVDTNAAVINIKGENLELKEARSASGARYTNERAEFWSKGDDAFITIDGQSFTNCRHKPEQQIGRAHV